MCWLPCRVVLLRRQVPARLLGLEPGGEIIETAGSDRLADPGHQLLIVMQVVPGEQHRPEDLVRLGEMRSEEHTSELQSLMRISYAVFCLKKKKIHNTRHNNKKI